MSVVQLVNMKLANRQAENVPRMHSYFPALVGNPEQQASKRITIGAAPVKKGVPQVKHELTLSHTVLPTRGERKTKAKPVGEIHDNIRTPVTSAMWTCITCNRKMLESQKEAHLGGKAHIARVKQVPSAASNEFSLPSTGKIDVSQIAKTSTTKKGRGKAKAKAGIASEQAKFGVTGSKGTQRRAKTAVTSTYSTYEPCGNADWGFIGFNHGFSLSGSEQNDYHFGGGDDYGLCDKDCGWCGHCMDNVNI